MATLNTSTNPLSHHNIKRTSVINITLDNKECDLLVVWDLPNEKGEQPTTVELIGQATNWERVELVREDDVHRGTYFHLLLSRMPVGIKLRMKFRIDGVHTVDDRYEIEPDDGFGDKNNLFYVASKDVVANNRNRYKSNSSNNNRSSNNNKYDEITFPVPLPFVGWALEAEQRESTGSISLESALLPQDMISTTRLYHSYMYMHTQKQRHPEMSWEDIKKKAARAKVSKQKSKKITKSMMKSTTSAVRHFGQQQNSGSLAASSSFVPSSLSGSSSSSSFASVRSSNNSGLKGGGRSSLNGSKNSRSNASKNQRHTQTNINQRSLPRAAIPPMLVKRKKKRRSNATQAGTLSYCEGLSIYELENRMSAIVKESRSVASNHSNTRNTKSKRRGKK